MSSYININVSLMDVAAEAKHDVATLLNEFGTIFHGLPSRPIIDLDELDADGAQFIERLYAELIEARGTGWTP